jgi:hypothetical protein
MGKAIRHQYDNEPAVMLCCEQLRANIDYWTGENSGRYINEVYTKLTLIEAYEDVLYLRKGSEMFGSSLMDAQLLGLSEYFGLSVMFEALEILKGGSK